MWLREQIGPQAYTVNSSILWLGLNKDEHPSPCGVCGAINSAPHGTGTPGPPHLSYLNPLMARRQKMIGSEQVPQQVTAYCDRAVTVF